MSAALLARVQALGVGHACRFLGAKSGAELKSLFKACDAVSMVFLFTSLQHDLRLRPRKIRFIITIIIIITDGDEFPYRTSVLSISVEY